eukprot:m.45586 g.45586  ORF g.45586 m.45586 type:complete len:467 (+) comp10270_c0_seq2:98-1498(+)
MITYRYYGARKGKPQSWKTQYLILVAGLLLIFVVDNVETHNRHLSKAGARQAASVLRTFGKGTSTKLKSAKGKSAKSLHSSGKAQKRCNTDVNRVSSAGKTSKASGKKGNSKTKKRKSHHRNRRGKDDDRGSDDDGDNDDFYDDDCEEENRESVTTTPEPTRTTDLLPETSPDVTAAPQPTDPLSTSKTVTTTVTTITTQKPTTTVKATTLAAPFVTTDSTLDTTLDTTTLGGPTTTAATINNADCELRIRATTGSHGDTCILTSNFESFSVKSSVGFVDQTCGTHSTSLTGFDTSVHVTVQPACKLAITDPQRWTVCSWFPDETNNVCKSINTSCCDFIVEKVHPPIPKDLNVSCNDYAEGDCFQLYGFDGATPQRYEVELVRCLGDIPRNPQCQISPFMANSETNTNKSKVVLESFLLVAAAFVFLVGSAYLRHRRLRRDGRAYDAVLESTPLVSGSQNTNRYT